MGFLSKDQLAGMMSAIKKYISDVINSAQSNIKGYTNKRIYTEISYNDLLSLANNNKLQVGTKYLIIDYVTTTTQDDTLSDGEIYYSHGKNLGLLVTAISNKALSNDAKYFTYNVRGNEDYASWDVKYCLYNDVDKFAWADNVEHDYIKFIKDIAKDNVKFYDNQGNEIDYPSYRKEGLNEDSTKKDSRYLQDSVCIEDGVHDGNYYFIGTNSGYYWYIDEYTYTQFIDNKKFSAESITTFLMQKNSGEYSFAQVDTIDFMTIDSYCNGKGVIYYMKDENGNEAPYDFKHIKFKHPNDKVTYPDYYYTFSCLSDGIVTDNSLNNKCYNNVIKEYYDTFGKLQLNNIVFINAPNNIECYNNTFGANCYNNSFGNRCYSNSLADSCYSNSFGNGCKYNSFGNYCHTNTFGNESRFNIFGNECYANTLGNYYEYCTFGSRVSFTILYNEDTASGSNTVRYYKLAEGFNIPAMGSVSKVSVTRGNLFETYVGRTSDSTTKQLCLADLATLLN